MKNYDDFDEKLLNRIKKSPATFTSLSAHMHLDANQILGIHQEPWRLTDRRLQALRKRGLIKYSRKTGWSVAEQKEKPCSE